MSKNASATFRIVTTFKQLLTKASNDELLKLKESLRKERRCISPLVVWANPTEGGTPILLDGHTRIALIEELRAEGVEVEPPAIYSISFNCEWDAVAWTMDFQFSRRNMTAAERAAAVLQNEALILKLRAAALARKKRGKKIGSNGGKDGNLPAHAPEGQNGETRTVLAEMAKVGVKTIDSVRKVLDSGRQDVIDKLLKERTYSIRQAETLVRQAQKAERKEAQRAEFKHTKLPPPPDGADVLDKILLADVLDGLDRIPKDSVDLTITSPPYALEDVVYDNWSYSESFENYGAYLLWLAEVMGRVFAATVHGGRCVVNIDATNTRGDHGEDGPDSVVHNIYGDLSLLMREIGWSFYGEICQYKQNTVGNRPNWGTYGSCANPRIRRNHEYWIIFCKGSNTLTGDDSLCDLTPEEFQSWTISHWYVPPQSRKRVDNPDYHPAPYAAEMPYRLIKLLSYVNNTILDPFLGSGTTAFVAKALNRHYIGIDNSERYIASAQRRLSALDGLTYEQKIQVVQRERYNHDSRWLRTDGYGLTPEARRLIVAALKASRLSSARKSRSPAPKGRAEAA